MNPQNKAKKPISRSRCLIGPIIWARVPSFLFEQQRQIPNIKRRDPCIISPNITPKKKGNEIIAKQAGFTSLQVGIPQVSMIYWKANVNSFELIRVGLVNPSISSGPFSKVRPLIPVFCSIMLICWSNLNDFGHQMSPWKIIQLGFSILRWTKIVFSLRMKILQTLKTDTSASSF